MALSACSSGPPATSPEAADASAGATSDGVATPGAETKAAETPDAGGRGEKRPGKGAGGSQGNGQGGSGGDNSSGLQAPEGSDTSSGEGSGEGGSDGGFALPPEGSYGYSQEGYEEFCQGQACDRTPLPNTQRVDIDHGERSGSTAMLTSVAHQSSRTTNTTDYRVTDGLVEITRLAVEVNYNGFRYAETYEPQPPIHALELPLRAGARWSGSWDAQVYGNYAFHVQARESIQAAGRTFDAFRIRTDVDLHGELEGFVKATIWIDPETGGILKSESLTHTKSALGTYEALVNITLTSTP